jgi:hypothetical protein
MGEEKKSGSFIVFLIFLIIILLVWGYVGEKQIQKNKVACKFGMQNKFCWLWHAGLIDETKGFVNDTTGSLKDAMSGNE